MELVTVCQGRIDWKDFAGRLIYQITQEGKHRFLVDLSGNFMRGMIRFAKAGHLLGMATPYGYDRLYCNAAPERMAPRAPHRLREGRSAEGCRSCAGRRGDLRRGRALKTLHGGQFGRCNCYVGVSSFTVSIQQRSSLRTLSALPYNSTNLLDI